MNTDPGQILTQTCSSEEPHANHSLKPDLRQESTTQEGSSCLSFLASLNVTGLDGCSGKMSPVSCLRTEEGILVPSSGVWRNWGMGGPTGYSTLNGSECPRDAVESTLSDIWETQDVPPRFVLTAKACSGILRRAETRKKTLPEPLYHALMQATVQNGEATNGSIKEPPSSNQSMAEE